MKLFRTDGYGNVYNPKYQEKQGKQDIKRNAPNNYDDSPAGDFWKAWDEQHNVIEDNTQQEKPGLLDIIKPKVFIDKNGKKGFIVREEDAYIIVKFNDNPIVQLIFKNKRGSL